MLSHNSGSPGPGAFYEDLPVLERGKKSLQELVAVMRKLLHSIYGMFLNDEGFDEEKFYRLKA
jgi:hypothetical protein